MDKHSQKISKFSSGRKLFNSQELSLDRRMKELYEVPECGRKLMPGLPVMARMDGRCFHTLCADMDKPFDELMLQTMFKTTKELVQETMADIAYTQSDEITLCWLPHDYLPGERIPGREVFFGGKIQKMVSILGSLTTSTFQHEFMPKMGCLSSPQSEKYARHQRHWAAWRKKPIFDARVWNVPNLMEAANVFLWREQDATRNSLSMLAQANFGHKELHKKGSSDMHQMLHDIGVNWNDLPDNQKRGTYLKRVTLSGPFTPSEIEKLPPKHNYFKNPDLIVTRHGIELCDFPPLKSLTGEGIVKLLFGGD